MVAWGGGVEWIEKGVKEWRARWGIKMRVGDRAVGQRRQRRGGEGGAKFVNRAASNCRLGGDRAGERISTMQAWSCASCILLNLLAHSWV